MRYKSTKKSDRNETYNEYENYYKTVSEEDIRPVLEKMTTNTPADHLRAQADVSTLFGTPEFVNPGGVDARPSPDIDPNRQTPADPMLRREERTGITLTPEEYQ